MSTETTPNPTAPADADIKKGLAAALKRAGIEKRIGLLRYQFATRALRPACRPPAGNRRVEVASDVAAIREGPQQVLPKKLFLKFANPNQKIGDSDMQTVLNEQSYYRKIAPRMDPRPSRDILDMHVDADTQQFHLLMADVSDTHFQYGQGMLPPTREACEQLFGLLATFHAQWWDHPNLGTEIGPLPEADHVAYGVGVEKIRKAVKTFDDLLGEFLSPARRRIYERILDAIPELRDLRGRKRLTEGSNLTLIHEDAHLGNVFFPRDPEIHDPFLIDWQTCRVQAGTNDLAYTVLWYPERRQVVEKPLVEHYHRTLVEGGVTGYTWGVEELLASEPDSACVLSRTDNPFGSLTRTVLKTWLCEKDDMWCSWRMIIDSELTVIGHSHSLDQGNR